MIDTHDIGARMNAKIAETGAKPVALSLDGWNAQVYLNGPYGWSFPWINSDDNSIVVEFCPELMARQLAAVEQDTATVEAYLTILDAVICHLVAEIADGTDPWDAVKVVEARLEEEGGLSFYDDFRTAILEAM